VSDDENNAPAAAPVADNFDFTKDQVARFVQEKWKGSPCEVCKLLGTWTYSPEGVRYVVLPMSDGKVITTLSNDVLVSLVVHCTNCGNIKLLAGRAMMNWIAANASRDK
jgi:hypothetical protein